ncbi:MAG: acyltransferase 3 [Comamonadaceae bacterium]|nr:MAG: acyltransferase 3 [Comamonadaceae bacterium]
MREATAPRQLRLDLLKLLCAQCIMLHHFSVYGPFAQALERSAPALSAWLFDYGRMAVQVFLVLGGYLAAASLQRLASARPMRLGSVLWRRYLRLIGPLLAALLLVSAAAALVRPWLQDDFVPAAPSWAQVLSHLVLMQDVLGIEALSVGVWYVAIDFQLYALLALLIWLGTRVPAVPRLTQGLVVVLMGASLFYANLQPDWDVAALYFFGAYGLGVMAYQAQQMPHPKRLLLGLTLVVLLALVWAFRERLVLALFTLWLLGTLPARSRTWPTGVQRWVGRLGGSSYGLFLTHFAVLLLVNALVAQWGELGAGATWLVLLASVLLCTGLGLAFTRFVEQPLAARLGLARG